MLRRGGAGEGAVSLGVEAAAEEPALDVGVPVVLDLIVCPAGKSAGYQ